MKKKLSDIAKQLGSRGGRKTAQRGRNYYVQIGKKGLAKRWGKTNAQSNNEPLKGAQP